MLGELKKKDSDATWGRVKYSRELATRLKDTTFDLNTMRTQGFGYERLDQLTTELLLGVR